MKKTIAVPVTEGVLSGHFGHCEEFYFATVEENKIVEERTQTPPEHEPGLYPKWVKEQGGTFVIAAGMGQKARTLFEQNHIETLVGAPAINPRTAVEQYLEGTLIITANTCNHH